MLIDRYSCLFFIDRMMGECELIDIHVFFIDRMMKFRNVREYELIGIHVFFVDRIDETLLCGALGVHECVIMSVCC